MRDENAHKKHTINGGPFVVLPLVPSDQIEQSLNLLQVSPIINVQNRHVALNLVRFTLLRVYHGEELELKVSPDGQVVVQLEHQYQIDSTHDKFR